MTADRVDVWTGLMGAYVGEVLIRAWDGEWVDDAEDCWAVSIPGLNSTVWVRSLAHRVLAGEPCKGFKALDLLPLVARRVPTERVESSRPRRWWWDRNA